MTLPADAPRDTLPGHGDEQGGLLTDGKRRAMLSILVLATALSSIDRQVLGLLLEPIRREFKLSDTQLGILSGPTFTVLYATLALPMAVVSDRVSRRAVITFAVSMFSVMTVMCGFAPSFGFLVVSRMGVAVGEAGAVPASQALVADIYPKKQLTSAMSRLYLSQSVGGVLAFLLGGFLGQSLGWRLTWILVGAPGVVLAFAGYLILPKRNPTRIDASRPYAQLKPSPVRGSFAFLWSQPTYRYLTAGNAFWSFSGAGIGLWAGPLLSRVFGLHPMQIGIVLAVVVGLLGAAGLFFIGDFAEKMGKRDARWILWVVAASVFVSAPLGCVTFLSVSGWTALVSGGLLAFFAISTQGPIASAVQMIVPPSMRSVAVAVKHLVVTAIGAGSGPLAVGFINDALKHRFGEQAIRYSLSLATIGFVIAAAFFLAASLTFRRDIARAEALPV